MQYLVGIWSFMGCVFLFTVLLLCKVCTRINKDEEVENLFLFSYKEQELDCPICLEQKTNIVLLPCNHAFHDRCILKWFTRNLTCPVCREEVGIYDSEVIT